MDRFRFVPFATTLGQSRRTLLGTALATAGAVSGVAGAAGKKKKKKKCKAPKTKCGKKACCQPGESCVNGQCAAPAATTTTPKPLTAITCGGPTDGGFTGAQRFAQIFEATGAGLIATASFELAFISANQPFGVEIRTTQNGAPSNTVLGTAIIFGVPANANPLTITATFAPKIAVEQGKLYALTITDVASKAFIINSRNAGICPGTIYVDNNANNTFFESPGSLIFTVSP